MEITAITSLAANIAQETATIIATEVAAYAGKAIVLISTPTGTAIAVAAAAIVVLGVIYHLDKPRRLYNAQIKQINPQPTNKDHADLKAALKQIPSQDRDEVVAYSKRIILQDLFQLLL